MKRLLLGLTIVLASTNSFAQQRTELDNVRSIGNGMFLTAQITHNADGSAVIKNPLYIESVNYRKYLEGEKSTLEQTSSGFIHSTIKNELSPNRVMQKDAEHICRAYGFFQVISTDITTDCYPGAMTWKTATKKFELQVRGCERKNHKNIETLVCR